MFRGWGADHPSLSNQGWNARPSSGMHAEQATTTRGRGLSSDRTLVGAHRSFDYVHFGRGSEADDELRIMSVASKDEPELREERAARLGEGRLRELGTQGKFVSIVRHVVHAK